MRTLYASILALTLAAVTYQIGQTHERQRTLAAALDSVARCSTDTDCESSVRLADALGAWAPGALASVLDSQATDSRD